MTSFCSVRFLRQSKPLLLLALLFGVALSPFAATAVEPMSCYALFNDDGSEQPSYRQLNPSAAQDAAHYRRPNDRHLSEYALELFEWIPEFNAAIRNGDVVIDIGGGRGRAMWDLANAMPVHALVINTQDFTGTFPAPKVGTLTYKPGWAEDVLKTLRSDSVNVAFDVYGAFTYSPRKDLLLEEVYRVLAPGGHAYFLFDHDVTPAEVETATGRIRLDKWLVSRYPEIFSVTERHTHERALSVIKITKPVGLARPWIARMLGHGSEPATPALSLNLETVSAVLIKHAAADVPRVLFRETDPPR